MVSISRTYAPNDFTVHLSKEDAESIQAYQDSLEGRVDPVRLHPRREQELPPHDPAEDPLRDRGDLALRGVRRHREADRRRRPPREGRPAGHLGPDPHLPHRGGRRAAWTRARPPSPPTRPSATGWRGRSSRSSSTTRSFPLGGARPVDRRPLAGERHRRQRPERVEEARADLARRQRLRRRGPRLDQRHPPRRRPHRPRAHRGRRRADLRPDDRPLCPPHRLSGGEGREARRAGGARPMLELQVPLLAAKALALAAALRLYLRRGAPGHRGPAQDPRRRALRARPGARRARRLRAGGPRQLRAGEPRARRRGLGHPGPADPVRAQRTARRAWGAPRRAASSSRATTTPRGATPSSPATGVCSTSRIWARPTGPSSTGARPSAPRR